MPRRNREDEPGCILHIYNRGLAKRTVFEREADVRFFLSRLAREHRRGRLLTHAYVVLANHFHLIGESPLGQASEAMRRIQNEYVRRFNRLRRRDGPLFRGRFGSRRVRSVRYWWTLLRYIDLHPVSARVAAAPGLYPFGSAYHYLTGSGPKWLTRDRVESLVTQGLRPFEPTLYQQVLAHPLRAAERELVTLRMQRARSGDDPLDELLSAGPSRIVLWMRNKAANADGTRPGVAVASPSLLKEIVARHRCVNPDWTVTTGRQRRDGWELVLTGLLREACALSYSEVAARLGIVASCVGSRLRAHRRFMMESDEYSARAAALLAEALEDFAGPADLGRGVPRRGQSRVLVDLP